VLRQPRCGLVVFGQLRAMPRGSCNGCNGCNGCNVTKFFPSFGMRFSYLDNVLWIKIVALTQNDSFRGLCMYLSSAMLSLIHKTLLNDRILTVQVTLPNIKSLQTKCLHTFLDGWVAFSLVPGLYAIHSDFGLQEHAIVLWAGFQ